MTEQKVWEKVYDVCSHLACHDDEDVSLEDLARNSQEIVMNSAPSSSHIAFVYKENVVLKAGRRRYSLPDVMLCFLKVVPPAPSSSSSSTNIINEHKFCLKDGRKVLAYGYNGRCSALYANQLAISDVFQTKTSAMVDATAARNGVPPFRPLHLARMPNPYIEFEAELNEDVRLGFLFANLFTFDGLSKRLMHLFDMEYFTLGSSADIQIEGFKE